MTKPKKKTELVKTETKMAGYDGVLSELVSLIEQISFAIANAS